MFKCAHCDKVYKTRTSLTRHAHNHSKGPPQHQCDTCGVLFARRDILNRHVSNGHCANSNAARHRCHTACEACRGARIKCDGQVPCQACFEGRRECKYPATTGRISHAARAPRTVKTERGAESDGMPSASPYSDTAVEGRNESEHRESPEASVHNVRPNDRLGNQGMMTPTSPTPVAASSTEMKGMSSTSDAKYDVNLAGDVHEEVSWPWLHENLFLLNGGGGKLQSRKPSLLRHQPGLHPGAHDTTAAKGSFPGSNATSRSSDIPNSILSPLSNVIENLVAYAAQTAFAPDDRGIRRRYWESVSLQLADIFKESSKTLAFESHRTLYQLAESFMTNFNSLWPILNHEQLDTDTHHPVLFLVVGSIGAMFGDELQREYGTLMHERLRRLLSASLYDLEGPDDGLVWLAQARVLTQIAALYFGQHQGFSYAQHIAAITVAQLRRMNFFREPSPDALMLGRLAKMPPEAELSHWKQAETRRRIAFGILRTDVYTSVLLSTRPLLTSDEFKLTFPRSDSLWLNSENLSPEAQLQLHRVENARSLQMPFADLVRVYLDKSEPNPELGAQGYELVMFGLQEAVWKFTQDPEMIPRLTGHCLEEINIAASEHRDSIPRPNGQRIIPALAVGQIRRGMSELFAERARLLNALDDWSHAVDNAINNGTFMYHRGTLLSCLMLYHLSRLRLCAPLEWLHHISYRAPEPSTVDWHTHRKTKGWVRSAFAPEAAQHAWDVKWLIESELQRPEAERAHFNFLAFCSLHHAAVVLWSVASTDESTEPIQPEHKVTIPRREIEKFLQDCPSLFSRLSSLGGNSFEVSAHRLAKHRFPMGTQVEGQI